MHIGEIESGITGSSNVGWERYFACYENGMDTQLVIFKQTTIEHVRFWLLIYEFSNQQLLIIG